MIDIGTIDGSVSAEDPNSSGVSASSTGIASDGSDDVGYAREKHPLANPGYCGVGTNHLCRFTMEQSMVCPCTDNSHMEPDHWLGVVYMVPPTYTAVKRPVRHYAAREP